VPFHQVCDDFFANNKVISQKRYAPLRKTEILSLLSFGKILRSAIVGVHWMDAV